MTLALRTEEEADDGRLGGVSHRLGGDRRAGHGGRVQDLHAAGGHEPLGQLEHLEALAVVVELVLRLGQGILPGLGLHRAVGRVLDDAAPARPEIRPSGVVPYCR